MCGCTQPIGDRDPQRGVPETCIKCGGLVYWPREMQGKQIDLPLRGETMTAAQMIGKKVEVGTHGFIRLVDVMGSDRRVVDAARISFGRESSGDDAKDEALLRYLMRNRHTSPFEQCEITFIVQAPMDVWRQWIRHRMANVNEYSTRYTEAMDIFATTEPDMWRLQSTANKQGSEGYMVHPSIGQRLSDGEAHLQELALYEYRRRLDEGVAKEQARKDLPLSTYTMAYWKSDLHNLLHFLELRMDSHAQLEIRQFATTMYDEFIKLLFPWTCRAFEDYRVNAITLTGPEILMISKIAVDLLMLTDTDTMSQREKDDLMQKVNVIAERRRNYAF